MKVIRKLQRTHDSLDTFCTTIKEMVVLILNRE